MDNILFNTCNTLIRLPKLPTINCIMRLFSNFTIFDIVQSDMPPSLTATQSHTVIINTAITILIVENCKRTTILNIVNSVSNSCNFTIELFFINGFIVSLCGLYTRNTPVSPTTCNINFRTIFFLTNGDKFLFFIPFNKTISCYLIFYFIQLCNINRISLCNPRCHSINLFITSKNTATSHTRTTSNHETKVA